MRTRQLADGCPGFAPRRWTRRQALAAGVLGLFGTRLAAAETGARPAARAKSVILLHQFGGPGQQETFDLKPDAPEGIRGEWKPARTRVPGLHVCELLPGVASVADKFCLVRTMQHSWTNHNPATYYSLTGHAPPSNDIRLPDSGDLYPAYGSAADRFGRPAREGMPGFVSLPHVMRDGSVSPGQYASFLGKAHDPLHVNQDPNAPDFALPELRLPEDMTPGRLDDRRGLLKAIDGQCRALDEAVAVKGIDQSYRKAIDLLTSPRVRQAFDLSREPLAVRERYGRTTYGQSCLLARRLVEHGVRFVNVYFSPSIGGDTGGWDMHGFRGQKVLPVIKNHLLPMTDKTLPALLGDLDERGLLDSTLVIWMGEFGRTPKINENGGRDHWPTCYTALLAGGGVRRGHVHGASDRTGTLPTGEVVRPDDLAATVYHLLGIDPATEMHDPFGRPLPLAAGDVVRGVLA